MDKGDDDGRDQKRQSYGIRYPISRGMDDEIPVQSAARESGGKAEGATAARVRGARNKDHQGKYRKRAHPYAGVMSTDDRAEQTDAVFEGKKLEDAAGGVR